MKIICHHLQTIDVLWPNKKKKRKKRKSRIILFVKCTTSVTSGWEQKCFCFVTVVIYGVPELLPVVRVFDGDSQLKLF